MTRGCESAPHHRRSIRLRDYDYGQGGAYFVTICTAARACILGDVAGEDVVLSAQKKSGYGRLRFALR